MMELEDDLTTTTIMVVTEDTATVNDTAMVIKAIKDLTVVVATLMADVVVADKNFGAVINVTMMDNDNFLVASVAPFNHKWNECLINPKSSNYKDPKYQRRAVTTTTTASRYGLPCLSALSSATATECLSISCSATRSTASDDASTSSFSSSSKWSLRLESLDVGYL